MKATKKIVGAACALVAAVALSAGSTYAWFTSNSTVTATGMKVEVNTSNAYLIIADDASKLSDEAITMTLASGTEKLLPSAYEAGGSDLLNKDGTGSITDEGTWYTAQGTSSTDGTLKGDKTTLTDFEKYVVWDDIFVGLSAGSSEVTKINMSVTADPAWNSTAGTANNAISVVILWKEFGAGASSEGAYWNIAELKEDASTYGAANHMFKDTGVNLDIGGLEADENYANYIQIRVMVYFDGNNAAVKTSNAANLAGVTLDFTFTDATPDAESGD